jgi:flagellar hook assembly protein FlgD
MPMLKIRQFLSASIFALTAGVFAPTQLAAANPATVLSVSFVSGDPALHIGSLLTAHIVVLDATAQMSNVTNVTPALVGSLTLNSPDLASVVDPEVFVTDGQRTWRVPFGGGTSVTIDNSTLYAFGIVPYWSVPTYIAIQNQTFRIYTGVPVTGGSAGAPNVTANLGTFGNVVLNDIGTTPDAGTGDGVWTAAYTIPDLGMNITGSRVYGRAHYNGLSASNDFFQSPGTLTIDAVRPEINSVLFTVPARPNYNNVLYLSALCQGTSIPHPTNAQGRYDVVVNKNNTVVDITIGTSPVKILPPIIIPAGSETLNSWMVWDGTDGAGNFVADGVYPFNVYIRDGYGVVGTTRTSQVRVTSMRFELNNLRLSPSGRTTQPQFADGLITVLDANVEAYRDNGLGLRNSLLALGWKDTAVALGTTVTASTVFNSNQIEGSVFALIETSFLDQSGNKVFGIDPYASHDAFGGTDYDGDTNNASTYAQRYSFNRFSGGDTVATNDWEYVVFPEFFNTGSAADPTRMTSLVNQVVIGKSPDQGNYRLRLRAKISSLTGAFIDDGVHFTPTINPEASGYNMGSMGQGIYAEDSSLIFQVSSVSSPISDTTPPVFLTSSPLNNSTVAPGVYGPPTLQSLTAQFQDVESSMDTSGTKSFITLVDPQGGNVPGVSFTDGGGPNNTLTLTFKPSVILNKGGTYVMTVNTCNNAGLCVIRTINVLVLDQTPPSVSAVELAPSVGANIPLSINQSAPEGPFQGIGGVLVTLSIPSTSTNTIDWTQSNVSLYQVVSGTRVPVPMTKLTTGIPSDGKLRYSINAPINAAGVYEISTQTFSKDAAGQAFIGPPPGAINPQFTTVLCLTCVTTYYAAPGNDSSRPAISAAFPLTVTSGLTAVNPLAVGVDAPTTGLPADTGWLRVNSALFSSSMRFYVSGVLQTGSLTWTYPLSSPVTFRMYYNDSDLGATAETDLRVRAYIGGAWSTVSTVVQDSLPLVSNSFAFSPTSSQPAGVYYAIAYPDTSAGAPSNGVTPTPYPFKSTRSFSPTNANPSYRKARFYYAQAAPKAIEVRIYDTAGSLVKAMSLGAGVNLGDTFADPSFTSSVSYYFEWDGKNDSGVLVKNGLYLVRWQLTRADGSGESMVKPVAMIR